MHNVKSFPDAYDKQVTSNIHKLMQLNYLISNDVRSLYTQIFQSRGIDDAYGKTLDCYGEMVGQKRNGTDDEQYRIMILNKIAQEISCGTMDSVTNLISQTFNIDKRKFYITEYTNRTAVSVEGIPCDVLTDIGFDVNQAKEMIKSILPVGVALEYVTFDGTLILTSGDVEDSNGLSDIEETTGGTLGWA